MSYLCARYLEMLLVCFALAFPWCPSAQAHGAREPAPSGRSKTVEFIILQLRRPHRYSFADGAPPICTSSLRGAAKSPCGNLEPYTSRSITGIARRTHLPCTNRLPDTNRGCGIAVQQRAHISISPARPAA